MERNPNRGIVESYEIPSRNGELNVRVPSSRASTLEAWISVRADFRATRESLKELTTRRGNADPVDADEPTRDVVAQALVTLAITRYARAFKGSVRPRIGIDVDAILAKERDSKVLLEMHKAFLLLRDKHIAHSVSPLEQPVISLALQAEPPRAVLGIGTSAINMSSPEPYDLKMLDRLAFILEAECEVAVRRLAVKLLKEAKSDLDWAYGLPRATVRIEDFVEAVKKKRK